MGTKKETADHHNLHYWARQNVQGDVEIFFLKPDGSPTGILVETVTIEDFNLRFFDCATHKCEFRKKSADKKRRRRCQ